MNDYNQDVNQDMPFHARIDSDEHLILGMPEERSQ